MSPSNAPTVRTRPLPSADWIAFGIGALGLAIQYLYPPALTLVAMAVFVPSFLREVGWLGDADELTIEVMHRAGFHALLAVAMLIFLNHLLPAVGWFDPAGSDFGDDAFPAEPLRKAVVWVFLLSYLIQYWGTRQGVTRILLGLALMLLTSLVGLFRHFDEQGFAFIGVTVGSALVFVAASVLVHRRPRLGGLALLGLGSVLLVLGAREMRDPRITWGMLSILLQVLLVFGVTGLALLRETSSHDHG